MRYRLRRLAAGAADGRAGNAGWGAHRRLSDHLRGDLRPHAATSGSCTLNADCSTDDDGAVFFTYTGDGGPGVDEASGDTIESNTVLKFWDVDCNQNEIPDTCDLDCGTFGGACVEFVACGAIPDDDWNGVPDDCNNAPDCAGAGRRAG